MSLAANARDLEIPLHVSFELAIFNDIRISFRAACVIDIALQHVRHLHCTVPQPSVHLGDCISAELEIEATVARLAEHQLNADLVSTPGGSY